MVTKGEWNLIGINTDGRSVNPLHFLHHLDLTLHGKTLGNPCWDCIPLDGMFVSNFFSVKAKNKQWRLSCGHVSGGRPRWYECKGTVALILDFLMSGMMSVMRSWGDVIRLSLGHYHQTDSCAFVMLQTSFT